ncbi:MAG: hypothetical protein ABFS38_22985 [Bacteroidota bacterium]
METFAEPKELVENSHYRKERIQSLGDLTDNMIDAPIVDLINAINRIPSCFTLQCCYGHFLYNGQNDQNNLDPLPNTNTISRVEYRIAYIAFCIENNIMGRELLKTLKEVSSIDPDNIQFCSADWFWARQVNSYALQVEPSRFKDKDKVILSYREALKIQKIRNEFFIKLKSILL